MLQKISFAYSLCHAQEVCLNQFIYNYYLGIIFFNILYIPCPYIYHLIKLITRHKLQINPIFYFKLNSNLRRINIGSFAYNYLKSVLHILFCISYLQAQFFYHTVVNLFRFILSTYFVTNLFIYCLNCTWYISIILYLRIY